jgi:glucosylceramidase
VPGKCVTVSGGGTANGTKIVLEPCTDNSAQRWTVQSDGTIRIFGKCLVLATAANGTQLVLGTGRGPNGNEYVSNADWHVW